MVIVVVARRVAAPAVFAAIVGANCARLVVAATSPIATIYSVGLDRVDARDAGLSGVVVIAYKCTLVAVWREGLVVGAWTQPAVLAACVGTATTAWPTFALAMAMVA